MNLVLTQILNGLQVGVLLFLMAAGLTLVFGIMNFVNLSHGALYMLGAFFGAVAYNEWESAAIAAMAAVGGTLVVGALIDRIFLRPLYGKDHLYQVLCTFGLILVFNELVQVVWGSAPVYVGTPHWLSGGVHIFGALYPSYRLTVILVGLLVGAGLYLLIHHTRVGMLIRAGAFNPRMVAALGVNVKLLNAGIFALGASLAGLAGLMASPIVSVQSGMGEPILILTLVTIVTGGVGSIRGAFFGAVIVGVTDTLGRAFIPQAMRLFLEPAVAQAAGAALASMLIYLLMAVVLAFRPQGLFPARHA